MRFPSHLVGIILTLALAGAWCDSAGAEQYGEIIITAEAGANAVTRRGYAEYRFTVTNQSAQDRQVMIVLPSSSYPYGTVISRLSRTVVVPAGATSTLSLLQPPVGINSGSGVAVYIDGTRQEETLSARFLDHGLSMMRYGGGAELSQIALLRSRGISEDRVQAIASAINQRLNPAPPPGTAGRGRGTPTGRPEVVAIARAESETSSWSGNWLAYTRWQIVAMTSRELRDMDDQARGALWRYVHAGGLLVLAGGQPPTEPQLTMNGQIGEFRSYAYGLGICVLGPDSGDNWEGLPGLDLITRRAITATARTSGFQMLSPLNANEAFRVVDKLDIPVRGMLALMIIFAVVIGPLNMIYLARTKRKILLLLTVPVLSIVATFGLLTYSVFAEGWRGRERTAGFTLLDERNHLATTVGWLAFYSPLTPGKGLHFSQDTEILPHFAEDPYRYSSRNEGNNLTIDWTNDQHLASGWVNARVPFHTAIRKSESRLERLTTRPGPNGSLIVVNGLGVAIRGLAVRDAQGRIFNSDNPETAIAPGAEANLKPYVVTEGITPKDPLSLRSLWLNTPWYGLADNLSTLALEDILTSSSYICYVDRSPFVEEPLAGANHISDRWVIYGLMRESE